MKSLVSLFICLIQIGSSWQAQVTVSVYYETKCDDSIRFITKQLVPTWERFGNEVLVIDYVPYGKAIETVEADGITKTISCHHGPEECRKNKEHACALKHLLNKKERTPFINCTMQPNGSIDNCTEPDKVEEIVRCVDGAEGNELLAEYGNRTKALKPELNYVPWILFDSVFSQKDQDEAQKNLTAVICEKSKACADVKTSETSKSTFLQPAINSISISFLTALIIFNMI